MERCEPQNKYYGRDVIVFGTEDLLRDIYRQLTYTLKHLRVIPL